MMRPWNLARTKWRREKQLLRGRLISLDATRVERLLVPEHIIDICTRCGRPALAKDKVLGRSTCCSAPVAPIHNT